MISKRFTWLLSFLGLMPGYSYADRNDAYPPITGDTVESEHYELRRLLCKTCGSVDSLAYLPERDSFFASARGGDLWQINRQGYIVDVLRGQGPLPDTGIYFGPETYIDWVFSGDKTPKAYSEIVNADHLSEEEFNAQLQAADGLSALFYGREDYAHFYLKEGNSWRILERRHQVNEEEDFLSSRSVWGYEAVRAAEDKNLPYIRIPSSTSGIHYEWKNSDNPLYLHKYHRQGRVRAPLLDFHGQGWTGTFGRGEFHLTHQNELLRFSALHRVVGFLINRSNQPDIEHYRLPQDHPVADVSFLGLYGRRRQLVRDEQGFFVVRPRATQTTQTTTQEPASGINQRYDWQPVFEGFSPQSGTLGNIVFVNGQDESPGTGLDSTPDRKPRPVPLVMTFLHRLPKLESDSDNYVKLNDTFYLIRDHFDPIKKQFVPTLQFDEAETRAAFSQLQKLDNNHSPIELNLSVERFDKGLVYRLALKRGETTIPLNKARLDHYIRLSKLPHSYILDRLAQVYENARKTDSHKDFMSTASYLVQDQPKHREIAEAFATATVKLMVARIKDQNADEAETLFYHYIGQILPNTGFHRKALDIASNALVLGIVHQRPRVIETTFSHLLDGNDFDIESIQNDILTYNLACYYALEKEKTKMLEAAARAVTLGKEPEQFLTDEDFSDYWKDDEFLSVIYQRG